MYFSPRCLSGGRVSSLCASRVCCVLSACSPCVSFSRSFPGVFVRVCEAVCRFVCASLFLSSCLCIPLSLGGCVFLRILSSVFGVSVLVRLSLFLYFFVYASVRLCLRMSLYTSACTSVCVYVCVSVRAGLQTGHFPHLYVALAQGCRTRSNPLLLPLLSQKRRIDEAHSCASLSIPPSHAPRRCKKPSNVYMGTHSPTHPPTHPSHAPIHPSHPPLWNCIDVSGDQLLGFIVVNLSEYNNTHPHQRMKSTRAGESWRAQGEAVASIRWSSEDGVMRGGVGR